MGTAEQQTIVVAAPFRLPERVHHSTATAAHHIVVPVRTMRDGRPVHANEAIPYPTSDAVVEGGP